MSEPACRQRGRPRVGVDFHTFDGIFQGIRSHLLGIYQEAIRLAPEIDFVFFVGDPDGLASTHPAFGATNVTRVAMPHGSGLARLGWQLAALRRRHRIDLLHLQGRLPFLPFGPCALTTHDLLFESHPEFFTPAFVRMARWTCRPSVAKAALLLTVSEFARDEMVRLYGTDARRIAVTPNGIDRTVFYPGDERNGAVRALGLVPGGYLCTVGRLEPRKNHLHLLEAYALLPPGGRPPLVVVGQRDFRSEPIFDAVGRLGLAGEVRFLENLSDQDLPAVLRHARVFVYPSFAEGFGMPVLEAMASGVPVVTSATTSLPEVAGDAALTVDPDDPAAIARAIQHLLSDPAARDRAVAGGLRQADRYAWTAAAQVLVDRFRDHFAPPARR